MLPSLSTKQRLTAAVVAGCVVNLIGLIVLWLWHPYPLDGFGSDFHGEVMPAYTSFAHGHVEAFYQEAPSYFGSLLMRAPLAIPALWLGARQNAVYFLSALPCICAVPALVGWLSLKRGNGRLGAGDLPLLLLIANPVTVCCLGFGHPEDLMAIAFLIAAVVTAAEDSERAAGVLVALAVASKPWAVCALPAVFAVLGSRRHALVAFSLVSALFWAPELGVHFITQGVSATSGSLDAQVGNDFGTPQLLYWLGPQNLISREAHPLIVVGSFLCVGVWWLLRGGRGGRDRVVEGLWLLALIMLVRTAFDPWNNSYYPLPFLVTLMVIDRRRMPWIGLLGSLVFFLADSPNMFLAQKAGNSAVTYALVAVPMLVALAIRVYCPPRLLSRIGSMELGGVKSARVKTNPSRA